MLYITLVKYILKVKLSPSEYSLFANKTPQVCRYDFLNPENLVIEVITMCVPTVIWH